MTAERIAYYIQNFGDDVYRFCFYLAKNKDVADDLYQDCFLTVFEKQVVIEEEKERSYLFGVVANLWKNRWRKEQKRQTLLQPLVFDESYQSSQISSDKHESDPFSHVVRTERSNALINAVNHLPERDRVVVLLYYSAELSTDEISKQLKLPKGTVTSRLKRARNKVRKEMEEFGYGKEE